MAAKSISDFKGQMPVRAKGQVHCSSHKEERLQLYCTTCQELTCVRCLSRIHKGHNFDHLQDFTPPKKEKILNFIVTSESTKGSKIQRSLESVNKKLTENTDNFEKLSIAAKAQAEKLKKDIDDVTRTEISVFKEIKENNEELLHQYKKNINKRKQHFGNFLKECKNTVQSECDIQVHDTEKEVDTYMNYTPPPVPDVQHVSFTPNLSPLQSIKHAFGLVTSESQTRKIFPVNTESGKAATTNRPFNLFARTFRQNQHLKTTLLAHFQSQFPVEDMSVVGEEAWVCCGCLENIALINKRGEEKRNIKLTDFGIGISVSPTTRHCWVHSFDGRITEVTPTEVIHRFNTTINGAFIIFVTLDEHILIGEVGLTKLTTNGKTVLQSPLSGIGEPLCVSPCRMSECRLTRNIAMVDGDKVVVVDKNFQKLFEYKGTVSPNDQAIAKKAWYAQDVAYDNTGNLVVCDRNTIYLISNDGMFLRQLFSETSGSVCCVCIDETDKLWVGSHPFDVKVLQYLYIDL